MHQIKYKAIGLIFTISLLVAPSAWSAENGSLNGGDQGLIAARGGGHGGGHGGGRGGGWHGGGRGGGWHGGGGHGGGWHGGGGHGGGWHGDRHYNDGGNVFWFGTPGWEVEPSYPNNYYYESSPDYYDQNSGSEQDQQDSVQYQYPSDDDSDSDQYQDQPDQIQYKTKQLNPQNNPARNNNIQMQFRSNPR